MTVYNSHFHFDCYYIGTKKKEEAKEKRISKRNYKKMSVQQRILEEIFFRTTEVESVAEGMFLAMK